MTMILRVAEFTSWKPGLYMFDRVLEQIEAELKAINPTLAMSLELEVEQSLSIVSIVEISEDDFASLVTAYRNYHHRVLHSWTCTDKTGVNEGINFAARLAELKAMLLLDKRNNYTPKKATIILNSHTRLGTASWVYDLVIEVAFAYLSNRNICTLAQTLLSDLDSGTYKTDLSTITTDEFNEFQQVVSDLAATYKTNIRGFYEQSERLNAAIKDIALLHKLVSSDARAKYDQN